MTITDIRDYLKPNPAPEIELVEELPLYGVRNLVESPEGTISVHRSQVLTDGYHLRIKGVTDISVFGGSPNPVHIALDITEELQFAVRCAADEQEVLGAGYARASSIAEGEGEPDDYVNGDYSVHPDVLHDRAAEEWHLFVLNGLGDANYTQRMLNLTVREAIAFRDRLTVAIELAQAAGGAA